MTTGDQRCPARGDWEGAAMARRRVSDPRVDPHEAHETTPCESCQMDLRILQRAQELTAEQGDSRNIMDSFRQEQELEAMWRRRSKRPKKQKQTP